MESHGSRAALLIALGTCLFFLASWTAAVADQPTFRLVPPEEHKMVSASGYADRWVDPDHCRAYLGCQSQEKSLSEARSENNDRIARVLAAIAKLKLPGLKTKAPSLNVQIIYSDTGYRELPKVLGYRVTQEFTVLLEDKDPKVLSDQAGQVIDTALSSGANTLGQVVFFREDQKAIQRELLGEAIKDALANATVMARAAGSKVTGVWRLSGNPQYYGYEAGQQMRQSAGPMGNAGEGTTIVFGQVKVACSASIEVTIE
jgi:hypothetical protein